MSYRIQEAHDFYNKFIFSKERQALLIKHSLHVAGSVPSIDWELFGAILTGDKGKKGYGSDLDHYEIKSSINKSSFEYQYHLYGGEKKLTDDMKVDHVFISYSRDYRNVEVRLIQGEKLKEKFSSWLPALKKNYTGPNRRQRFRKNIPYGIVKKIGKLIMKIENGKLTSLTSEIIV